MPRGTTVFERHRPSPAAVDHALAGSRRAVFWLEDAATVTRAPLTADLDCDLAIVGGGYLGLWTALLAKQRDPDARVVLLEARTVGWAASGRNGGFCEASITHGEENGRTRFGDEYDALERMGLANLDAIESTVAELGLDVDFERNGALDVATEPHQVEWLREGASSDARYLAPHEVQAELASPTYLAGLWRSRDSALVHPGKLAAELARACENAGVVIHERSPVASLDEEGGSALQNVLAVNGRRVRAGRVALATNAFPSLLARTRLLTVPVYDYVLMTEPLTADQKAAIGWDHRQGVGDSANQFHYYRLSADDRILWGGYDAVYHYGGRVRERYEERPSSYRRLAEHFLTTFPQLEGVRFSHRWAGAIDTCSRFCAYYGKARGGTVAYAAGFTGLGVGATRFAALVMLDFLAGEATERTETRMVRSTPLPFPPEPLAFAGIQATKKALDAADHDRGRRNLVLSALDAAGLGFDS